MDYLTLKYIHIISSTILFGTGVGTAFFMYMANRTKDTYSIYFTTRHVVMADWRFTTPTVIIQLITGLILVDLGDYRLTDKWILVSLCLYLFAGLCWLPVVWLQIKMRDIAKENINTTLPARYWQYSNWWILLGTLAFPAVLIVFYLMVFKPL